MLKRILVIASGVLLGATLSMGVVQVAAAWGFWPNRELEKSAREIRDVLNIVNENYVDSTKVGYPQLTESALRAIVDSLDPHSEYMNGDDYKTFKEGLSNEFGGIGVQVEMNKGNLTVVAPIAGTPGDRAGIMRGDILISVEGEKLVKPELSAVITRLRGKPGTKVTLGFQRPSTEKEYEVTIVRELIKVQSVRDVRLRPDGIGYIQITQFSERTGEEFVDALKKLNNQGMRALILDLRDNPGGLLTAAVAVAEPFFKKDELIVYTQGRKTEDREEFRGESDKMAVTVPVAVLINAGSASASEVVSGALKDTRKAVIIGERSFGKGSVQSIIPLGDGNGIRLTTARYYTPSGVTIHEKGVTPDVEVVMSVEEDLSARLQRYREDVVDPVEFKERFKVEQSVDRQMEAAVGVLQSALILESRDRAQASSPVVNTHP